MKQKQPDYIELLKKSLYNLRDHPVVFIPIVYGFLLFIMVSGFIVLEGLFMINTFGVSIETLFSSIISSSVMMMTATLFIFIDILLLFLIGSFIGAMSYAGFYQVSIKNKVSLYSMTEGAKPIFLNVLKYSLLKFVIFFIPLAIVAGIIIGLVLVNWILALVIGIMFFMILMAYMVYMGFGMFFMAPMITSSRKPIMEILRSSFKYLHNNISHVLLTWVVLLCVGAVTAIVIMIIVIPLQLAASLIPLLFVPAIGLRVIIQVLVGVYNNFYIFNSYFDMNKVKK